MNDTLEELQDDDYSPKPKQEVNSKLAKNVESLSQKWDQLQQEKEKLAKKIEALKRNYEGLSFSTKNEKNDYLK